MVPLFFTLATLMATTKAYLPCSGSFCPPTATPTKEQFGNDPHNSIFLGRDPETGCSCRDYPSEYIVCFGRDTCRKFPKNFNFQLGKQLRVKGTQIVELKPGDLKNLTHLQEFHLEGNHNFSRIHKGSFYNMTKLIQLTISYNENLRALHEGCFDGLVNLQELFLVKNAFVSVQDLAVALTKNSLPVLQQLYLNENNFLNITQKDFQPMMNSSLTELSLVLCQIEEIHARAFVPLRNLQVLHLGENNFNITTLVNVVEETTKKLQLRALNLYSTGLRRYHLKYLLEVVAKSNITSLCLAKNQFEIISSDTFPKMPNLQLLDLSEVLALNITTNAFVGLPNLKTLVLNGNKLSSIPEGVLLEQLSYLDLRQNSGNEYSVSYLSIFGQKFAQMKKLEWLDLSYNRIFKIYNHSFEGLSNLKTLGLKNATIFQIADNSFSMLGNLTFLTLENNHFLSENRGEMQSDLFRGLFNLEVLLLGACDIRVIKKPNPFRELKSLIRLGLEKNKLTMLEGFQIMPHLVSLDLSYNNLLPWRERLFKQMKDFRGNHNKFAYLTSAMIEDFQNLSVLELKDNPFTCDCRVLWKSDWILTLLENQSVLCAYPESASNMTIVDFYRNQNLDCKSRRFLKLSVLIPSCVFIVLVLALGIIIYLYRWHLRYWIFLTRLYLSRKGKTRNKSEEKSYTNYLYDAFVSYSNEDRNFVIRLVTMLEKYPPFLRLCVYERDFQIGTMISENVLESVARSRKTLLIISDSYAKSQWCRWESQIAEHHRLFLQNDNGEYVDDSLILIKLGPVSQAHLTPTLKFLLRTRIYLQWDVEDKKQKVFWEKLRGTLAPPEEIIENTYL